MIKKNKCQWLGDARSPGLNPQIKGPLPPAHYSVFQDQSVHRAQPGLETRSHSSFYLCLRASGADCCPHKSGLRFSLTDKHVVWPPKGHKAVEGLSYSPSATWLGRDTQACRLRKEAGPRSRTRPCRASAGAGRGRCKLPLSVSHMPPILTEIYRDTLSMWRWGQSWTALYSQLSWATLSAAGPSVKWRNCRCSQRALAGTCLLPL